MAINLLEEFGIELTLHDIEGATDDVTDSLLSIEYDDNFGESSDRLTLVMDDYDTTMYNFFEQGDIVSVSLGNQEDRIGSGKMEIAQLNGSFGPNSFEVDAVSKYTVQNTMETTISISSKKIKLSKLLRDAATTAGFDKIIIDKEFDEIFIKNVTHRRIKAKNLMKDYVDKFGGFIKVASFTGRDGSEKKHIYIHRKSFFLVDQNTGARKDADYEITRIPNESNQEFVYGSLKKGSSESVVLRGFSGLKWDQPVIEVNEFENDYTDPRTGKRYVSKKKTVYKSGTKRKKAVRVESDNENKTLTDSVEEKQEVININFSFRGESANLRSGNTITLAGFFPLIDDRRYLVKNVNHTIDTESGWSIEVSATSLE